MGERKCEKQKKVRKDGKQGENKQDRKMPIATSKMNVSNAAKKSKKCKQKLFR